MERGTLQLELDIDPELLTAYLRQKSWIDKNEEVLKVEKPGEGNMNLVIRAITSKRRLILKQSRPYVQKYPQIAAPEERTLVESSFYQRVVGSRAGRFMPAFIGIDETNRVLAVEDLGESADYTFLYKKSETISEVELDQLTNFLNLLHHEREGLDSFPKNLSLRKLNSEHLFLFPFMEDNGFDLDTIQPGLQEISMTYKTDPRLRASLKQLGEVYMSEGDTLLHGDFYPGSWLRTGSGVRIIDPEFCYVGHAAYDIGIFLAHLIMAELPTSNCDYVVEHYHRTQSYDDVLRLRFTGMEILRRIIGLAQLPLELTLAEKEVQLKQASEWVIA